MALVQILAEIEKEPHHWPIGRTTFQKIAYFATESELPTGLRYERGSYGPYAPDLKVAITRLVNHALIREEQLGRMFAVKVGPTFADAYKAYEGEIAEWRATIDKVADLFMRMRTQQAEVAATVHFAARSLSVRAEGPITEMDVLAEVMRWKQRRRPSLNEADVALTIRGLSMLGWLKVKPSPELPVTEEVLVGV
ncbi:MAG: hypothetical protein HY691_18985 [Chloroflexi bacterium]|nr:hypothetical protein [Chloroflexota bacterium]